MDLATKINIAVLIVNSIAAFAAVVAAIIAVVVYKKTAKLQRRAINVSLFDMRTEILVEVIHKRFKFERTRAKMLFNDEIDGLIETYDNESAEATRNKFLRQEYVKVIRHELSDDTYDDTADFLRQIQDYECMNPEETSAEVYEQIRESIRSRRLWGKWHHGVSPTEYEYVDYITADDEYNRHFAKAETIRQKLQEQMKLFIESSIK